MQQAILQEHLAYRPILKWVWAVFGVFIALSLAAISSSFAERLLAIQPSAFTTLSLIVWGLMLLAVLSVIGHRRGSGGFFITVLLPFVGTFCMCAVVYLLACWVYPQNGWAYLTNTSVLQSASQFVEKSSAGLKHPDNRFIAEALASKEASVRLNAEKKIESLEVLSVSEFNRLLLCLSIVEAKGAPQVERITKRGWASQAEADAIERWARENLPSQRASMLQMEAWLHLVGEKTLDESLSVALPKEKST